MLDITSILKDPELGATAFTVIRKTYRRREGTSSPMSTKISAAYGCIHPAGEEGLELLPEEEKKENRIVIYTPYQLSMGTNDGITWAAADQILYNNSAWRVISVKHWEKQGFVKAIAVLVQ